MKNCVQAKKAGANVLVSGSTIFNENNGNLKKYRNIKNELVNVKFKKYLFLLFSTSNKYYKILKEIIFYKILQQIFNFKNTETILFLSNPLLSLITSYKKYSFKISEIDPNIFWIKQENLKKERDIHSFLWLNLIDRKNDGKAIQKNNKQLDDEKLKIRQEKFLGNFNTKQKNYKLDFKCRHYFK